MSQVSTIFFIKQDDDDDKGVSHIGKNVFSHSRIITKKK